MQELKRAAAVFCIACICAELLAQLTEHGWARHCIKTVAGLYILLVFWNTLPKFRTTVQSFELPQSSVIEMETLEDAVRSRTETELAERLAAECEEVTGVSARFIITLQETASGVEVSSVQVGFPAGCSDSEKDAVTEFLRTALGRTAVVSAETDREAAP